MGKAWLFPWQAKSWLLASRRSNRQMHKHGGCDLEHDRLRLTNLRANHFHETEHANAVKRSWSKTNKQTSKQASKPKNTKPPTNRGRQADKRTGRQAIRPERAEERTNKQTEERTHACTHPPTNQPTNQRSNQLTDRRPSLLAQTLSLP